MYMFMWSLDCTQRSSLAGTRRNQYGEGRVAVTQSNVIQTSTVVIDGADIITSAFIVLRLRSPRPLGSLSSFPYFLASMDFAKYWCIFDNLPVNNQFKS